MVGLADFLSIDLLVFLLSPPPREGRRRLKKLVIRTIILLLLFPPSARVEKSPTELEGFSSSYEWIIRLLILGNEKSIFWVPRIPFCSSETPFRFIWETGVSSIRVSNLPVQSKVDLDCSVICETSSCTRQHNIPLRMGDRNPRF